uniref:Protein Spindly n=1 Tax=Dracunculus medinensis TaxID=318479 RepID=A0A0N4UPS5_DRAME
LSYCHKAQSNEDSSIRSELEMFKYRNSCLIDQLRQKSMEYSKLTSHMNSLYKQIDALSKRCQLNEALERLTLSERAVKEPLAIIDKIEKGLRNFEDNLQLVKSENIKSQQAAIALSLREQNNSQSYLEQIERLQRENLSLLHLKNSERGNQSDQSDQIQHFLDFMSSYDALYSFTMGVLRKLGQMRTAYLEKVAYAGQLDLELMHVQSSLLVTYAQVERLKLLLKNVAQHKRIRPVSYHGEDYFDRLVKPELSFLLPFKLHASRLKKLKRSDSINIDLETEKNEESIETEFLRIFDYAKCMISLVKNFFCQKMPVKKLVIFFPRI